MNFIKNKLYILLLIAYAFPLGGIGLSGLNYMVSYEGDERIITCDSLEEFMNLLDLIRKVVDEDIVAYVGPLTSNTNSNG